MDPELARYLNRSLWEKRDSRTHTQLSSNIIEQTPSAPFNSSGIIINLKVI